VRAEPALRRIPVVIVSVLAGKEALAGEWVVPKPIDEDELVDALGAAMLAGRSRILVVARESVREQLGTALERIGVEFDWATNGAQAARLCEERRFEVALVDAGLRSPQAVLEQIDLRGRRVRPTVVVFAAEDTAQSFARLDAKPVSLEDATTAVLAALAAAEQAAATAPDPG
jgi:CheY-like chemotaxis protein